MLHMISQIDKSIPVVFLNTGFLFPQTIAYKDLIADIYGLEVITVASATPRSMQKDNAGRFLFASDPDYCCHINKVLPMEPILRSHDVWINGVRADQNANRSKMKEEQRTPQGAMRYHPMLPWTNKMIWAYIKEFDIPRHPLEAEGYSSIGCEPCTRKVDPSAHTDERMARWFGMNKTECGLHTELIK
jgi:phosphoadenosine phosphosulfate reductase